MKLNNNYNPLLILTALPFESRTILSHHKINIKPKKLTTYQLKDSIYLIEVPIGFKFNLTILNQEVEKLSPKLIINFGICGALDSSIQIGLPFYINKVFRLNKDLSEIQLPKIKTEFESAALLTVDEPVLNAKRRDELDSQTSCTLVDLEAFHITRFCEARRLPLVIVKIASDLADEDTLNVIKTNQSELRKSLADAYINLMLTIQI